ncbi:MAG: hypothetical protein ACKODX_14690 [Gemmata sp.]|jgi:hypothetical protein
MAKTRDRDRDDDRPKRPQPVKRDGPYLMMLFITLVAMTTGCVLLYLDNDEYGAKPAPKEAVPTVRKLGDPVPAEAAAPPAPAPATPTGMP